MTACHIIVRGNGLVNSVECVSTNLLSTLSNIELHLVLILMH